MSHDARQCLEPLFYRTKGVKSEEGSILAGTITMLSTKYLPVNLHLERLILVLYNWRVVWRCATSVMLMPLSISYYWCTLGTPRTLSRLDA